MLHLGYVTANLQIGEKFTVEQLLYVMLVGSANDASLALAEHVSGSVEEFCKLMNEKAKAIGCTGSNFVNPNGVHDENNYSTAYDLALIAKYCMQNETFRTIVSTTSYKLPPTDKYKNSDRLFTTTNELLIVSNNARPDNYYYKYATGIKTGFTTPAGNCLIGSASKNNLELITVVLDAWQTDEGLSGRYLDAISMFDYGFNNYSIAEVGKAGDIFQTIYVPKASSDTKQLDIVLEKNINILTNNNSETTFSPTVSINEDVKAPLKKNDVVGKVTYTVDGIQYESNLLAKNDVHRSKALIRFLEIIFLFVIIYVYMRIKKYKKRNRRVKKLF